MRSHHIPKTLKNPLVVHRQLTLILASKSITSKTSRVQATMVPTFVSKTATMRPQVVDFVAPPRNKLCRVHTHRARARARSQCYLEEYLQNLAILAQREHWPTWTLIRAGCQVKRASLEVKVLLGKQLSLSTYRLWSIEKSLLIKCYKTLPKERVLQNCPSSYGTLSVMWILLLNRAKTMKMTLRGLKEFLTEWKI